MLYNPSVSPVGRGAQDKRERQRERKRQNVKDKVRLREKETFGKREEKRKLSDSLNHFRILRRENRSYVGMIVM